MAAKVMVSFPDEFLVDVDRVAHEEHHATGYLSPNETEPDREL